MKTRKTKQSRIDELESDMYDIVMDKNFVRSARVKEKWKIIFTQTEMAMMGSRILTGGIGKGIIASIKAKNKKQNGH